MARVELHKPLDKLYQERNKIDQQLTTIKDEYDNAHEQLKNMRADQFAYKEGKAALSNTNQNRAARKVFDDSIASCQKSIQDILQKLDVIEKNRVIWYSKSKAIEKSIKELQNA